MNFPDNLKRLREAKKITQQKLADELGIRQSCVANWETGLREPKLKDLPMIAETSGVTMGDLVK